MTFRINENKAAVSHPHETFARAAVTDSLANIKNLIEASDGEYLRDAFIAMHDSE